MRDRVDMVPAWRLAEGDVLPGYITVLCVHRDPVGRTVHVLTDEPAASDLPADSPVAVVRPR